jgi:FemAB-related protein (PEP-CTERM system-associated)
MTLAATDILESSPPLVVRVADEPIGWDDYLRPHGYSGFALRPEWLRIFARAFGHRPYFLEARCGGRLKGVLPVAFVRSLLFGKRLASLPYLNTGGLLADDEETARLLVDQAVALADRLRVKNLELRQERAVEHPALGSTLTSKVHLRLPLPGSADALWNGFKAKLRSQIKKPLANPALTFHTGQEELLPEFYSVFCANMRDLGTPPYSKRLFQEILAHFPREAELCVLRHEGEAVSAALLVHGPGVTQVPSASTLRSANRLSANMLLYWRLLERTIERGQSAFDFGRSTVGAGTYDFKKQWGAEDHPAIWQYYVREGTVSDLRPDGGKYDRFIQLWKRLPVAVTRWIGPSIVKGIP